MTGIRCFPLLGLALCIGALTACGSGGGGGGSTPSGPPVTLSGTATYDRVPATISGLDYAHTVAKPIRGATVETRNAAGTHLYYSTTTDANGAYTISAPANTTVLVVVRATLGEPTAPDTRIVDNTASDAVYAVAIAGATTTVNQTGVDIHAGSGWGGSSYTGTRASAPFAILDTIYAGHLLLKSANPAIVFPTALVGWSVNNSTSSASIGTSHYSPDTNRLSILGKADEDTDEFDDHVIAHEWGHWFEASFSRSDSVGGSHGGGDILDETVAFGEGWGNAFSGMVTDDPLYFDTMGSGQATTGVAMDLEADEESDTATVPGDTRLFDGGWSETSVQEILWDIFDGHDGTADPDADGVALGFTPLYQVFTGAQKTTPGFTTIYSFLYYLKNQQPAASAAISTLEAAENIGAHDEFEQSGKRRFTTLTVNAAPTSIDVDGHALTTYDTYGSIDSGFFGNKLYNRLLFKATIPATGNYRVRVTPATGGDVIIFSGGGITPAYADAFTTADERLDFPAVSGQVVTFAVGSFATTTFTDGQTPFTIRLGTPATVGKPAPAKPVAPRSNG